MVAATATQTPRRVNAPPVPQVPVQIPVRIPAPRRPLDDAVWPLEHRPQAAGQARQVTRTTLKGWGLGTDAADVVVLVVCELVTNAVEHAQAPLALHLHRDINHGVWVGVSDGGPAKREGAWTASCASDEHGRGMAIVGAVALSHGTSAHASGSTHWARLAAA